MTTPLPPLPRGPVASIDEAVARMQAISAALPEADGLASFNRMYLTVTTQVRSRIGDGSFADVGFMDRLDVVFANLYLAAVDAWAAPPAPRSVPRSWDVLLARHDAGDLAPMQFALAGMNAHISHDLALAVVATCRERRTSPGDGAHHADFESVNSVLAELEPGIQRSFESGLVADLDRRFAGLDNLAGNFSISAAREVAWSNACTLWHLGDAPLLATPFVDGLDRMVAFAGRALLLPLPRA
ncbi:MAG: DUF5995 family protein [Acidimicrobiales bacterium]